MGPKLSPLHRNMELEESSSLSLSQIFLPGRYTEHLITPALCVIQIWHIKRKEGNLYQCLLKVRNGNKASHSEQLELGCSFGSSPFRRALRVMRQNTESSPRPGPPPIDSNELSHPAKCFPDS